jgi:prevent-host-death family protein
MTTVGLFEARNRRSGLVERAARGEVVVITRSGDQVAGLMPPQAPDAVGLAQTMAARIRQCRERQVLGGGVSIRDLIEAIRHPLLSTSRDIGQ